MEGVPLPALIVAGLVGLAVSTAVGIALFRFYRKRWDEYEDWHPRYWVVLRPAMALTLVSGFSVGVAILWVIVQLT